MNELTIFFVITWCASQVMTPGIPNVSAGKVACYERTPQIYATKDELLNFYNTLNWNQKQSAKMFALTEVTVATKSTIVFSTGALSALAEVGDAVASEPDKVIGK